MNKLITNLMTVALFMTAAMTSCNLDVSVTDVILNETEDTITMGGPPLILTCKVMPSSASNKSVTWKSSDPDVATVNQDGIVTAVAPGVAIITVITRDGEVKAHCTITVENDNKSNVCDIVSFKDGDMEWVVDDWTRTIKVVYPHGTDVSSITPAIVVSPKATVSPASGKPQDFSTGEWIYYTVTAENGKAKEYRAKAEVAAYIPVTGVTFNGVTSIELTVGGTLQLKATVMPENASDKTVTWKSDNEAAVTVNNEGTVIAVSEGKATITVTTQNENKEANYVVTVIEK